MALAKIKKIQLVASKGKKAEILEILQDSEALDIIEIADNSELKQELHKNSQDNQKIELAHANVEFAIKLLNDYGKKRGLLEGPEVLSPKEVEERVKNFDYEKIVKECSDIEEKVTDAKNNIVTLKNEIELYSPWSKLEIPIENIQETSTTKIILGSLKTAGLAEAKEKILKLSDLISLEVINQKSLDSYILVIFEKELEREIRQTLTEYKFTELEVPQAKGSVSDYLKTIKKDIESNEKTLKQTYKELKELGENLQNLHVAHDYLAWQLEKSETLKKLGQTEYSFMITGWMPEKKMQNVKENLDKITKEYELIEVSLDEGEVPPVELTNGNFMQPFEAVTKIYGLPKSDELDPTPFLAAYFIIFFALCLTDAGYGLIMFFGMLAVLKFFKLADGIKKLVRLLMYGGLITFFIGALFGGWFGLTPDQVPEVLTYTTSGGEKFFIFQKISAISNPIAVLILSLALGFIQIVMGVFMKFFHDFKTNKKEAVLDHGTWLFLLIGIGFAILAASLKFPPIYSEIGTRWVQLGCIILILTQGREKKNIIGKFISGILSLYGLVGYLSDILSYSRILALGLATTIIGLAVNTVAGLVSGIPYVGWFFVALIFIGGHIFNLLINALGSFIHSGRLQFVEFFTKFMEGGGAEFKPFSKKSKYIFIKNNS